LVLICEAKEVVLRARKSLRLPFALTISCKSAFDSR
jgi:hypothetical protein